MYLTADSPDTITQLEKGKVYILGGLVDRNAHKGLCFKKATVRQRQRQRQRYRVSFCRHRTIDQFLHGTAVLQSFKSQG